MQIARCDCGGLLASGETECWCCQNRDLFHAERFPPLYTQEEIERALTPKWRRLVSKLQAVLEK